VEYPSKGKSVSISIVYNSLLYCTVVEFVQTVRIVCTSFFRFLTDKVPDTMPPALTEERERNMYNVQRQNEPFLLATMVHTDTLTNV
jgi:hypothetical protein